MITFALYAKKHVDTSFSHNNIIPELQALLWNWKGFPLDVGTLPVGDKVSFCDLL